MSLLLADSTSQDKARQQCFSTMAVAAGAHCGASRAARWAAVWALLAAHECIDVQIVDVPVPQIAAKIPEVVETIAQEHISDDLLVPQVVKENLEVIKVPQEREDVVQSKELETLVSEDRVQQRRAEALVPVPQIAEEAVAVVGLAPSERVRQWTVDETVEVQENVEIEKIVSKEQSSELTREQFRDIELAKPRQEIAAHSGACAWRFCRGSKCPRSQVRKVSRYSEKLIQKRNSDRSEVIEFRISRREIICQMRENFTILKQRAALERPTFPVNPQLLRVPDPCFAAILDCFMIHGIWWVLQETSSEEYLFEG